MIDLSKFPCHKKPYADSTLRNMKKGELIGILRDYEHNYGALYSLGLKYTDLLELEVLAHSLGDVGHHILLGYERGEGWPSGT